jgi:hypothetical protein
MSVQVADAGFEWAVEAVPLCFCGRRAFFTVGRDHICNFHKEQLIHAMSQELRLVERQEWREAMVIHGRSKR